MNQKKEKILSNHSVEKILEISNLRTSFFSDQGELKAVDEVSFAAYAGKTLGIVGESGCGKSVTSLSIMRLIPFPQGKIIGGQILYRQRNLLELKPAEMRGIRGNEISMIFQEPMTSLNPVFSVGDQISEIIRLHQGLSKKESLNRSIEVLKWVGIPAPEKRVHDYPHHLSGGMRQRVMIAMALSCNPRVLIADEPTTALDVTIQAQILELLSELKEKMGMAVILITHDLGVVAEMADEVVVMYAGRIVEQGSVRDIFSNPKMPYTKGLLNSIPTLKKDRNGSQKNRLVAIPGIVPNLLQLPIGCRFQERCSYIDLICCNKEPDLRLVLSSSEIEHKFRCARDISFNTEKEILNFSQPSSGDQSQILSAEVLLSVRNLSKEYLVQGSLFGKKEGTVRAVSEVSFDIRRGETLGLVGESGCGKSTLGRCLLRLIEPTSGQIIFQGQDMTQLNLKKIRNFRRHMQIIFQDPYASLNPRMTVEAILSEPLDIHHLYQSKQEKFKKIYKLLDLCGLRREVLSRYPHEFSGGQRQRVCIARALAVEPEFIVCDEPVSALDVSIQAQIVNLMQDLQEELKLTYLFISHDLKIIEHISSRVAVMYLGKIVEMASVEDLYRDSKHPYTKALMSSIPVSDPNLRKQRVILKGDLPSPLSPPSGCSFHPRCPMAQKDCQTIAPILKNYMNNSKSCHSFSCHHPN